MDRSKETGPGPDGSSPFDRSGPGADPDGFWAVSCCLKGGVDDRAKRDSELESQRREAVEQLDKLAGMVKGLRFL